MSSTGRRHRRRRPSIGSCGICATTDSTARRSHVASTATTTRYSPSSTARFPRHFRRTCARGRFSPPPPGCSGPCTTRAPRSVRAPTTSGCSPPGSRPRSCATATPPRTTAWSGTALPWASLTSTRLTPDRGSGTSPTPPTGSRHYRHRATRRASATRRSRGVESPTSAARTGRRSAPRSSTSFRTGCRRSSTSCASRPARATRRSSSTSRTGTPISMRGHQLRTRPPRHPAGRVRRGLKLPSGWAAGTRWRCRVSAAAHSASSAWRQLV